MGVKVIGLVGGIASGKSSVAALFAQWGAVAFDADKLAHEVLAEDDIRRRLVERWGADVLAPTGDIHRPRVAQKVFGAGEGATVERRFLEGLLHPRIRQRIEAELDKLRAADALSIVVIDAPLLVEAGWAELCDEVVFVDAPSAERFRRAASRGWTVEQFSAREASQLPIVQKRSAATHVLHNYGAPFELEAEARKFWEARREAWLAD